MRTSQKGKGTIEFVDMSTHIRRERILAARREEEEQKDLETKRDILAADRHEKKYLLMEHGTED